MIEIAPPNFLHSSTIASAPPTGVDLWLLDLTLFAGKAHSDFASLVSAEEIIRAQQFKINASHFLATRALIRASLSRYSGIAVQDLEFTRGHHGKPFLTNAPSPLYFNLSHGGNMAVLAVTNQGEVGVDIETLSERDYLKIAKRYFHESEVHALHQTFGIDRDILFYKLWTLKEAFFKATGGGISTGLAKIAFCFEQQNIIANLDPALEPEENYWHFHQEFIAKDKLVALALNSPQPVQYQWINGMSLF